MNISTNPGVFYIQSGANTYKVVESVVKSLIANAYKVLGEKNKNPNYTINVVKVGGKPVYSYAFIEDKRIINMLQGLNTDGTKRIQLKPDQSCKHYKLKPNKLRESLDKSLKSLYREYFDNMWEDNFKPELHMKPSKSFSWADYQEEEDSIKYDHSPKVIKVELPPLLTTPFTSEGINVLPAAPRQDVKNKLAASGLGNNITVDDIRSIFSKYDSRGNYRWNTKTEIRDYFPIVNKTSDTVTIEFDPYSLDSSYAIHMQKKTIIKGQELLFYSP